MKDTIDILLKIAQVTVYPAGVLSIGLWTMAHIPQYSFMAKALILAIFLP